MAATANPRTDFFVPRTSNGQPLEMRIVWPWLDKKKPTDWENKPLPPDEQQFEATFFVPKLAATPWECPNYIAITQRMMEVIGPLWGTWKAYANGREPTKWPITDCDLTAPLPPQDGFPMPVSPAADFLEKYPWARGHWKFRATALSAPRVSDQTNNEMQRNERLELIGIKGGDHVLASINMWGYAKGTGGVGFGFEGVKKTRDGDPVGGGGGRSIEQMFGAPTGAPVNYGGVAAAPALPPGYAPAAPAYAVPPTPGAPAGYPTAAGAPGAYAQPAASPSAMAPPMTYAQPQPAVHPGAPTTGAYPSNPPAPQGAPAYGAPAAPPAPAYGAPAGQPVAAPAYGVR